MEPEKKNGFKKEKERKITSVQLEKKLLAIIFSRIVPSAAK